MIRICRKCNKEFFIYPSQLKQGKGTYCSKKCSGFAHRNKIKKECVICKKPIEVRLDRIVEKEGNTCSIKCKNIAHSIFMKGKPSSQKGIKISEERKEYFRKLYKGKHFSPNTEFKKGRIGLRGKNSPNWKGGKITRFGYKVISHPTLRYNSGASRYVFEHRYIMEQHLKRELSKNEIIHHKNGIKTDNRLENLKLVLRKTHFGNVRCPHCLKEFLIK